MSWNQLIDNAYNFARYQKSDIHEHIPVLYELGLECDHVTEMGVRTGNSTRAFLKTDAALRSYDLKLDKRMVEIFNEAVKADKDVEYIAGDVLTLDIEETDLLFIDTWHCYAQLCKELELHGNMARKYLVFHDTFTYGLRNESGQDPEPGSEPYQGLLPAIIQFIIKNPHWRFKEFYMNNNGLTVLERV
tara:strand:+ start:72 stop:638 length:567 start_codon:yes stop_codon:yes gene_type:complete